MVTGAIRIFLFAIAIPFVVGIACSPNPNRMQKSAWDYETKAIERQACAEGDCSTVSVRLPVFEMGALQSSVENTISQSLSFEENPDNFPLDSAIKHFLDQFLRLKQDFPDAPAWQFTVNAEVKFQNDTILSIVFESFSFTGGAHPNSFLAYLNFDKISQSEISNELLVRDKQALLDIAEAEFRKIHAVMDGKDLRDDDRFFLDEKGEFFLPAAIGFEEDSLVLYYNSYEIAPYVMGPTEIRIPLSVLDGMVAYTGKNR